MLPNFIYPLIYVLSDTLLLVFIKVTSVNGHTSYNTFTANAITELIKLSIAVYGAYSDGAFSDMSDLNFLLMIKFIIPNLMYAINNNLFHYSVGALSPAIFVVTINTFRTLLTAAMQSFVSDKPLFQRQYVACALLALSFIFSSLPDIIETVALGGFHGSKFSLLLYLASIYSGLSVIASLSQEKLLKDSKSLMYANVINYSIGLSLQLSYLFYSKLSDSTSLFKGFGSFLVILIPFLMALSGLSISFILRYFDNIVKLICSCFAVLFVHMVTLFISGESVFSLTFIIGWALTLPAAYLYYTPPPSDESSSSKIGTFIWELFSFRNLIIAVVGSAVLWSYAFLFVTSDSSIPSPNLSSFSSGFSELRECKIYDIPYENSESSLKLVSTIYSRYGTQFSFVDTDSNKLMVGCNGGNLYVYDSEEVMAAFPLNSSTNVGWRHIKPHKNGGNSFITANPNLNFYKANPHKSKKLRKSSNTNQIDNFNMSHVDWKVLLRYPQQSHVWLWCDLHQDMNLVVVPPSLTPSSPSTLARIDKQRTLDYINTLPKATTEVSTPSGGVEKKTVEGQVFDSVLIVYLDAVSRLKFEHFYKRSFALLRSMFIEGESRSALGKGSQPRRNSTHYAFHLSKYHSLGLNSAPNYVPFMSGANPTISSNDQSFKEKNSATMWLNDIAAVMGYHSVDAYDSCHFNCEGNCTFLNRRWDGVEIGGYGRQYLKEHNNRPPAQHLWPSSAKCEAQYSAWLRSRSCSTCADNDMEPELWMGNKPAIAHVFEWLRSWLATPLGKHRSDTDSLSSSNRRFAAVTIEDTHQMTYLDAFDIELEQLLLEIFFPTKDIRRHQKTAMLLLADHGMHFDVEFAFGAGKIANKQPFGYMMLPKPYVDSHPKERENLVNNADMLVTGLDLRSTVEYWLTGRDSSSRGSASGSKSRLSANAGVNKLTSHSSTANSNQSVPTSVARDANSPQTYASLYGKNLHLSKLSTNRTCADAGIPADFCGCGKMVCDSTQSAIAQSHFGAIATYVNNKILESTVDVTSVCRPIHASDLFLVPGRSGCIAGLDGSISINVVVKRSAITLDVLLVRDINNLKELHSKGSYGATKLKVSEVITVGKYRRNWAKCSEKLHARNISSAAVSPNNWQHCHCVEQPSYIRWAFTLATLFSK